MMSMMFSGSADEQMTMLQPAAVAMRAAVSLVTMPPVPHCVPVVLVSAVRALMSCTSWMGVASGFTCAWGAWVTHRSVVGDVLLRRAASVAAAVVYASRTCNVLLMVVRRISAVVLASAAATPCSVDNAASVDGRSDKGKHTCCTPKQNHAT